MPKKLNWSDKMDQKIIQARVERKSWTNIGKEMGLCHWTVVNRAKELEIWEPGGFRPEPEPRLDMNRPPLPAGHPTTWGLLTDGTSLAGTAYPMPGPGPGPGPRENHRHDTDPLFS